jgi:hydroxymethylpyrimidine/phosphomethylpyrimidine kinase
VRRPTPPVALAIAGSDSCGGAGIQADLTTFAAHGVHGACAVTAVTVQDTTGVHAIHPVPPDVVAAQARAVLADLPVAAVKTGMLGDAGTVAAVAELAATGRLPQLVVDPVLVATSGDRLTTEAAATAITRDLLPHAVLATPNGEEAAALLGVSMATSVQEQKEQAVALLATGVRAVVVTGGRDSADRVDVFAHDGAITELRARSIATANDHGTGCTFAAAAAAALSHGAALPHAVAAAHLFVRAALTDSARWRLGRGAGPVSHLSPTAPMTTADTAFGTHQRSSA